MKIKVITAIEFYGLQMAVTDIIFVNFPPRGL